VPPSLQLMSARGDALIRSLGAEDYSERVKGERRASARIALRERPEDILWFARRFLRDVAQQNGGVQKVLSPSAEKALLNQLWPGNERELCPCIESANVLTPRCTLDPHVIFDEEQACGRLRRDSQLRWRSPPAP
jgi:DNA-binding NtrC family response regulator